jgi:hypothetical protein
MRTILDTYQLARDEPLLLERRARPRFSGERVVGSTRTAWGEVVSMPAARGPLLLRVEFGPSLVRALVRTAFREGPAYLEVRVSTGEQRRYRFVPDNAVSGLWMSPLPLGAADLPTVFRGQAPSSHIEAVRFEAGAALRATGALRLTWIELVVAEN